MKEFNLQEFIFKFLKFGTTGFICMLIDFSVTWFFKEKVKASRYLANAMGFLISATVNFFINRAWTFHNTDPNVMAQYGKFFGVALIGLGINTSVLYISHHKYKLNFYVGKLAATGVTVFWNFLGNLLFTFS